MSALKISITIPGDLIAFLNFYSKTHNEPNRSRIVVRSLELLRKKELNAAYKQANDEIESEFDICSQDGLND